MANEYTRTKYACYTTNITMAIVGNLPPVLFLTFRNMYGISYTLLGLLVLINFCTQLIIDLIFSFFSHKFNIANTVKITPFIGTLGLVTFALLPFAMKGYEYIALVIGTVIFSASSGLAEVLISPTIAAIPSDNPERAMSALHSIYAWGSAGVIVITTIFILFIGGQFWYVLTLAFALVPFTSFILFMGAKVPVMETPKKMSGVFELLKNKSLWLCVVAIFLGGASECTMAQWSSSYIEQALSIPKVWGDICGVAMFGVTLGIGRTLYAKFGKNISKVLFLCSIGATLCYLVCVVVPVPIIGLIACALTGFCTSMLWPGSLIVAEHKIPSGGVFIFAMMAAGGDLGASVGPQLVGVITDSIIASPFATELASALSISVEALGMKAGLLVGMLFPLIGIIIFGIILRSYKKEKQLGQCLEVK